MSVPIPAGGEAAPITRHRMPVVRCPVCNSRAHVRSSEEISPQTRQLYYACSNYHCAMTWVAMLSVERVLSPSGISPQFRPAHVKDAKPPGHEYGQLPPLLGLLSRIEPSKA